MAINISDSAGTGQDGMSGEVFEYRLMLFVVFAIFLGVVVVSRTAIWRWRAFGGNGYDGKSIVHQARLMTYSTVPFVFMR